MRMPRRGLRGVGRTLCRRRSRCRPRTQTETGTRTACTCTQLQRTSWELYRYYFVIYAAPRTSRVLQVIQYYVEKVSEIRNPAYFLIVQVLLCYVLFLYTYVKYSISTWILSRSVSPSVRQSVNPSVCHSVSPTVLLLICGCTSLHICDDFLRITVIFNSWTFRHSQENILLFIANGFGSL